MEIRKAKFERSDIAKAKRFYKDSKLQGWYLDKLGYDTDYSPNDFVDVGKH